MSPSLQNRNRPSKTCTVSGCGGMMTFHTAQETASAREESPGGTWVCDNNPTHTEGASPSEDRGSSGR
jgi:hypothetical protein